MKVLYVHDGPLGKDVKTGNYYGTHYKDEIRKRYLYLGDHLTFLIRVKNLAENELKNYNFITNENFSVVEAPNHKSPMLYLKNIAKVKQMVKEQVQAHDMAVIRLPSALGNFALDYAEKYKKPYLVEVVACPWDALWNHSFTGKLLAPFKYRRLQSNMQKAKHSIYVTTKFLQDRYPTKGHAIGLSDVEITDAHYDLQHRLDKIRDMKEGDPVILSTVAALNVRYKGQGYVIKAIADLKKEGFNYEYHLVGGGDPSYLVNLAKEYGVEDRVKVIGSLRHEQVFEWFEKIDLYIQPSNQEGLPRALVEAMSRACPSIGSTTGGIPELLDDKFVFPKRNVEALKNILRNVTKQDMEEQAVKNYEKAKSFYKPELEARRKKFYDEFLEDVRKNTKS